MSAAKVADFGKRILGALTGNVYVPVANPPLTLLESQVADVQAAIAAFEAEKTVLHARKLARDAAVRALQETLRAEARTVVVVTEGDETKIASAGFRIKPLRGTPLGIPGQVVHLVVRDGLKDGSLRPRWKRLRGVRCYEVQASLDPTRPELWALKQTSTKARATIETLRSGTKVWLRVRAVGAAGPGPWSDAAVKTVP
jgi:hypothetical protein